MNPTRYPFYTYTHNSFVSLSMIANFENPKGKLKQIQVISKINAFSFLKNSNPIDLKSEEKVKTF